MDPHVTDAMSPPPPTTTTTITTTTTAATTTATTATATTTGSLPPPCFGYALSPPLFDAAAASSLGLLSPPPQSQQSQQQQQHHHYRLSPPHHAMPHSSPPSGSRLSRRGGRTPLRASAGALGTPHHPAPPPPHSHSTHSTHSVYRQAQHHPYTLALLNVPVHPSPAATAREYHKYFAAAATGGSQETLRATPLRLFDEQQQQQQNNHNNHTEEPQEESGNEPQHESTAGEEPHRKEPDPRSTTASAWHPLHHHPRHPPPYPVPPHHPMVLWNGPHHPQFLLQQQPPPQPPRTYGSRPRLASQLRPFRLPPTTQHGRPQPTTRPEESHITSSTSHTPANAPTDSDDTDAVTTPPLSGNTTHERHPSQHQPTTTTWQANHSGCTCKRTRCLKLYCQCFAAKAHCGEACRCVDCYNNEQHAPTRQDAMRMILARNPTAFDTKFLPRQQQQQQQQQRRIAHTALHPEGVPGSHPNATSPPTDAHNSTLLLVAEGSDQQPTLLSTATNLPMKLLAHKTGCKCRKSGCMKKYCECYAAGVKCSSACRCMGCKNMGTSMSDHGHLGDGAAPVMAHSQEILPMPQPYYHQSLHPYGLPPHHLPPLHPILYHPHHPLVTAPDPMGSSSANSTPDSHGATTPANLKSGTKNDDTKTRTVEPWLAAHNLTSLKRGSPSPPKPPTVGDDAAAGSAETPRKANQPLTPLPSLAASSSGEATSPTQEGEGAGVNSLLMAAMAMTGDYDVETSSLSTPLSLLKKRSNEGSESHRETTSPKRLRLETPSGAKGRASAKNPLLSPIVSYPQNEID